MAATLVSGTTAVLYGSMRDNVMALEVVLADGRIIRTGSGARRSSADYDLTALVVGSEGTLGLITELSLKLQFQPEAIATATCAFITINAAARSVTATIAMGAPMVRIEFQDAASVAAVNVYSNAEFPVTPQLMVEFYGSDAGVAEQANALVILPKTLAILRSSGQQNPRTSPACGNCNTTCIGRSFHDAKGPQRL